MLFVSKIKDFRIIRRPADRIMDEQRRPIVLKGERVEFNNWRFNTDDPDLIEWLINHPEYGITFTSDQRQDRAVAQPKKPIFWDTDDEATAMARAEDNLPREMQRADKKFEKITSLNRKLENMKKQAQKNAPQMLKGAMSTAWGEPVQPDQSKDVPAETKTPTGLTEDKVAYMINSAINSAVEKMATLTVQIVENAMGSSKKKFHCKECGEEFSSGMEVGKHKLEAHTPPKEV